MYLGPGRDHVGRRRLLGATETISPHQRSGYRESCPYIVVIRFAHLVSPSILAGPMHNTALASSSAARSFLHFFYKTSLIP